MAYDRFDRDERSRWSEDHNDHNDRNWRGDNRPRDMRSANEGRGRDERGFWDRASDEVASWFGDDEAERRRRQDTRRDERFGDTDRSRTTGSREYDRGYGRDFERDRSAFGGGRTDRDFNYDRGVFNRGGSSERDYNPRWQRELSSGDRDSERSRERSGYRPMTGDYGRGDHESEQFFAASGQGRGERGFGNYDRSQTPYGRDETRRTSFAGSRSPGERDFDPHYHSWRDRHLSELDRDYDDYRREHQSKFETDFGSWREKRQQKRGLLGQIREHMDVVGKDDEHVGKIDKVAGDRIILTKSDPDSGGVHHSLSCSDIDKVEGDRVILDCSADEAKNRWRDESRGRALFEREDQGEMGPRNLDRSFSGTYR
jgi:hypothetical protein